MSKKRKARPLLIAGAGLALIAMANSSCSGNLLPAPACPDGGYGCYQPEVETMDAGVSDAGTSDGGMDGGTDGGP